MLVAGAPELTLAWSEYQALYGESRRIGCATWTSAQSAALVEFLWRAAPLLSLAHDVAAGGLAVALAEAGLWSGVGAELELRTTPRAGSAKARGRP